jgi:hypothetical protein
VLTEVKCTTHSFPDVTSFTAGTFSNNPELRQSSVLLLPFAGGQRSCYAHKTLLLNAMLFGMVQALPLAAQAEPRRRSPATIMMGAVAAGILSIGLYIAIAGSDARHALVTYLRQAGFCTATAL